MENKNLTFSFHSTVKLFMVIGFLFSGILVYSQNYDSASGATQLEKEGMSPAELVEGLMQEGIITVISTVNSDGTPNAAVFGMRSVNENVLMTNIADTKTTKINLMERKSAIMILVLPEKNEQGHEGAKVVLKYIEDEEKIESLKKNLENVRESATFFEVVKIMAYHYAKA